MTPPIERRVRLARENVAAAERELDAAIADVSSAERAEKTMITEALRSALDNVASARTLLEAIGPALER